jgi:hypothetical protein
VVTSRLLNKALSLPGVAEITAILGGIVYFLQTSYYSQMQASILDEGAYLLKGFLFATGKYVPFQDYGPWGNHMPLAFLIPGYVQTWFGPGLRTGRYFSIALGLLMLLGLWIVANRLGNAWWAAAAIWVVAVNPLFARIYSMAVSQVLVACMLVWIMVLVLDEKPSTWRLLSGSALAAILLMTRINMILVLPVLVLYIFWQFGLRQGLLSAALGASIVILGHAAYWPGILRLWASWLPSSWTPFLNAWRIFDNGVGTWDPVVTPDLRWLSLWYGVRYNFIALAGLVGFGVLGLQRGGWMNEFHRRAAIFLSALSALLLAVHAWAALGKDYCVFCFSGYLTFFTPLVFLLIILTYSSWQERSSKLYRFFVPMFILAISMGAGFGSFQETGDWLLNLPLPRFKGGQILTGNTPLWGLLENLAGLDYKVSRWIVPSLAGLVIGLALIGIAIIAYRSGWFEIKKHGQFGLFAMGLLLALGMVLSPTVILGGGFRENDCSGDVIAANEQAGRYLATVIPPGSQVYWDGSLSAVPLLYPPGIKIYPPQINDGYAYRRGGNTEQLLRAGLWNNILVNQWKKEADFIIIEEKNYSEDWKNFLESGLFQELQRSPSTAPCRDNASLRVFRKNVK